MINIGKRIKNLRETSDISARKLAQMTNLDPSQISKIERGGSKPSLDALERICKALNISLSEFFSEVEVGLPPEQRRLLESTKSLTKEQIALLTKFLKSIN
ncbi:helix-turn-helix domain-containing protein [Pseudogracilibacillus sp. SO30301A]|uniref:helix-turn-helix domain-containing protein n=1 Tax=Pseudogracilibacillus sp. SO30301A TaxID=3098291 RepID=UPI00300DC37B